MISDSHPFYLHFSKVYGAGWPDLLAALIQSERQIARQNILSPVTNIEEKCWSGFSRKKEFVRMLLDSSRRKLFCGTGKGME